MPPRFHTVLFDLDGTLLDSIRLIIDSYHHTLAAHGLPPRTDAHWLAGIGTPLWVQFREFATDAALMARMVETYRDYNIANHDRQVRAYPGAVEAVRALRAAGVRTGLVTSKMRTGAERGLRFLELADAMDVVVAVDDVANPKPHPEPLLHAARRLGVGLDGTLFVGDSVHDMHCGRAAGARTAAALWGPMARADLEPAGPDYWLERPGELPGLVLGGGFSGGNGRG
jgi:pyrophosphatase PpaX